MKFSMDSQLNVWPLDGRNRGQSVCAIQLLQSTVRVVVANCRSLNILGCDMSEEYSIWSTKMAEVRRIGQGAQEQTDRSSFDMPV